MGAMVIFITVFVQFIIEKNNFFKSNGKVEAETVGKILKGIDHLFTATYYLQHNKMPESQKELEKARIFLRSSDVMTLRRSIKPLKLAP